MSYYNNNIENEFILKRDDLLPSLVIKLKTRGCMSQILPFNLSGVSVATFSMKNDCGDFAISSQVATIEDSANGVIKYSWQYGDTSYVGRYKGEFKLYFADGTQMTIPRLDAINIRIIETVNDYIVAGQPGTPVQFYDKYITDAAIIARITSRSNWDEDGNYIGSTTGIVQGQVYFDDINHLRYEFNGTILIRLTYNTRF
jgi:hypothetical protein